MAGLRMAGLLIAFLLLAGLSRAANVGPVLPLAALSGNQQNPTVVALPDKGFFFVAWEDWQNPLDANIYGAFVKPDTTDDNETSCRAKGLFWYQGRCYRGLSVCKTFPIITEEGNQQQPAAAYDPEDDKILVVWKDDGSWDPDHGWLQLAYRVLNAPDNCTSIPLMYAIQWIPYDPVFDCWRCGGTDNDTEFECNDELYFKEDNIAPPQNPPNCNDPNNRLPLRIDRLLARNFPRVVYNSRDRSFWFAWMERRDRRNPIWETACGFGRSISPGEGIIPAYAQLSVINADWDNFTDKWQVVSILNTEEGPPKMARRLEAGEIVEGAPGCPLLVSPPPCLQSFAYEYFTDLDAVDLAINPSGGVVLTWSGKKEEALFTFCRDTQGVGFSYKISPVGEKNIWVIHSRLIKEEGRPSKRVSEEGSDSYHPTIEYDPVTNVYLVVWEDTRDTGKNAPKIYGQLLDALGEGIYQANFPLTSPEEVGEAIWPWLKQTHPFITWDPVNQRFFVAWQDNRAGAVSVENIDIYGHHVDPEGSLRGQNMLVSATERGQPTAGNQLAPKIAYDPASGLYLAVWKDARNYQKTGSDIYAQAFSVGQGQLTILDEERNPLHPTVIDFGVLHVGERVSKSFFLKNTGDAVVKICELSQVSAPFGYLLVDQRLVDGDETSCLELQPLMQVEVMVEFAPTEEGSFSATIGISTDAGEHTILLQGATRPVISVDRTNFEFGEVLVGNSRSFPITLINHIEEDVTLGQVLGLTGPFTLEGISSGAVIPAGGSLTGRMVFSPQEVGSFEAEVTLVFSRGGRITLQLSGTGKESPLFFDPSALDFGSLKAGHSKELSFVVENRGQVPLTLTEISGPEPPFALVEGPDLPWELPPGGSFRFKVAFTPGERGIYQDEMLLSFRQGEETIEASYALAGRALGLPACVGQTLPARVMLNPGQRPVWLLGVTGDEDLMLSRMAEPGILGFLELSRQPGSYLFALTPPEDLEPYTYRDRLSLLFAGARRPLKAETTLILTGPPPGWEGCVPTLALTVGGKPALLLKNGALPEELHLTFGLNLPCLPEGAKARASLKVIGPGGEIFSYDLAQGFVPYERVYEVTAPLSVGKEIRLGLPPALPAGLWLFELRLEAGGEVFYRQAAVVVDALSDCQTIDLEE